MSKVHFIFYKKFCMSKHKRVTGLERYRQNSPIVKTGEIDGKYYLARNSNLTAAVSASGCSSHSGHGLEDLALVHKPFPLILV